MKKNLLKFRVKLQINKIQTNANSKKKKNRIERLIIAHQKNNKDTRMLNILKY